MISRTLAIWRIGLPFALYLAAVGLLYAVSPWSPAFDDPFHIPDGIRWMKMGELDGDGLFLRVPLWPMMLGSTFSIFGVRWGLILLQAAIVLGALICLARQDASDAASTPKPNWIWIAPAVVFALSPQIVLYSRHAVNELWIGLLAMLVMGLGRRPTLGRALCMGAIVAAAGMTKVVGFALIFPAALLLMQSGSSRLRLGMSCLAGFAGVALPLLALHVHQHGIWLLDNTGAYQLSVFTLREWRSFDGPEARHAAGMSSFVELIRNEPLLYLRDFAGRSIEWLLHPSSADFASFFPAYPGWPLRVLDEFVFAAFGILAVIGTRRDDAAIWSFVVVVWLASTFPTHTPYTPKLLLLFPWLLLAPAGLAKLAGVDGARVSAQPASGADRAD